MRGKVLLNCPLDSFSRITPAYAGKSWQGSGTGETFEDHPCICGEKIDIINITVNIIGSPLHMRGKVGNNSTHLFSVRITPAYAGKSKSGVVKTLCTEDHPCICGEKFAELYQRTEKSGSPLHMRGKVHNGLSALQNHRITPAYAGKS